MDASKYRVLPEKTSTAVLPKEKISALSEAVREYARKTAFKSGCLTFVAYFGFGVVLNLLGLDPFIIAFRDIETLMRTSQIPLLLKSFAPVVAGVMVLFGPPALVGLLVGAWVEVVEMRRQVRNTVTSQQQGAELLADRLTSEVRTCLEKSLELEARLPEELRQATRSLAKAQHEYRANAYAPFWDAVGEAALHLSVVIEGMRQLSQNIQSYYASLQGRRHTFPVFPMRIESLPDPTPVVDEFQRTVRMGQTEPWFAMIWEQYRTRQVLRAGFHTLGDAVQSLAAAVEQSIDDLHSSVSSDLTRLEETEIRSGKAATEGVARLTEEQIKSRKGVEEELRRLREEGVKTRR